VSEKLRRRLARLGADAHREAQQAHEDEHERQKRLKEIRETAEQENERYLQEIIRERRGVYIRRVGIDNITSEALRDENYLSEDDVPPFEITPDGKVVCARDGKAVTTYHQTRAEAWYWEEVEQGGWGLIHDEQAEAFYTPEGEVAVSRTHFDLRHLLTDRIKDLEQELGDLSNTPEEEAL
jgi:hypothetical protein